jgi:hypothetical protein
MKLVSPSPKLGMTTLLIFASIGLAVYSRAKANAADETATAHAVAVKGYLRDAECPLRYRRSMKPQGSCAMDCVKNGSSIALITKKGELFIAVDPTPEKDVRPLVMPHFGKYVEVMGDILERGSMRAVTVKTINEVPDHE